MLILTEYTPVAKIIPSGVDRLLREANNHVQETISLYGVFERNPRLLNQIRVSSIGRLIQFLESFQIPENPCVFQHELPHPFLGGFDVVSICELKEGNLSCSHAESNGLLMACLVAERALHELENSSVPFHFGGRELFEAKAMLDMRVNQSAQDGKKPIVWMGWARLRQTDLATSTQVYVTSLITRLKSIILVSEK